MKFRASLLVCVTLLILSPFAFADHSKGTGIGGVIGTNYGIAGAGANLGLSLKLPSMPIFWAAYLGIQNQNVAFGITGDKYLYDQDLVSEKDFNLDWYFGIGGYLNMGTINNQFLSAAGVRFPAGLSWHINKEYELFLALDPSVGISLSPELKFPDLFFAAELGLRYWMKK
ncbi:MAG TPA: hypothetical protein PLB48_00635 [Treponema sp.]|jgi:hypothetical protein|nr:hypothetical protein [Treponema sp.]HGJ67604.1 hypothetical protein [bacterium]HON12596.1 hypothetical protein [Treponema sp.]HPC70288.1 hypothetical protein [Treponema sp.]HRS02835.1 hypothetical protein [Treponema sp.]